MKSKLLTTSTRDRDEMSGLGGENDVEASLRVDDRLLGSSIAATARSQQTLQTSETDEEPIFEASFDLTEERLRHIFSTFDTDADGRIDYDSLKRGLEDWQEQAGMQISALEEQAFAALVSVLDSDASGDISYDEFAEGFRLHMLRALLPRRAHPSPDDEGAPLEIIDYDSTRLERINVGEGYSGRATGASSGAGPTRMTTENFFFKRRDGWVKTRWVDVVTSGSSRRAIAVTMNRLAVKYLLHPLALEDALETDIHRPKVEVFSSHYFLIIPLFSLETASSLEDAVVADAGKTTEEEQDEQRQRCYHRWNLCSCCNSRLGRAANDRLYSRRRPPLLLTKVEMISVFVNVPRNDTIITCNWGSGSCSGRSHFWQRVQGELEKPYSKLRQYDAQYLTYALLDQAVDLLVPIAKTMRREIEDERGFCRQTDYARGLRRVHEIRRNLERICRTIKPFVRVLTHVIEDDAICPGVTVYLRDVLDNLECADEDLRQLIEQCEVLDSDADKFQDRQMNRTLYILTVISAIFLPAQFLTGVWGMNFTDMPELETSWGYEMFWIITGVMTFALLVLFCAYGRIRNHED